MKKTAIAMVFLLLMCGCFGSTYHKKGTFRNVTDPAAEKKAKAELQFNKATDLLAAAQDKNTGTYDDGIISEAIDAYKAAIEIDGRYEAPYKQLAIIYETIKNDESSALEYYKAYYKLAGKNTEKEIIAIIEEYEGKNP